MYYYSLYSYIIAYFLYGFRYKKTKNELRNDSLMKRLRRESSTSLTGLLYHVVRIIKSVIILNQRILVLKGLIRTL